MQKNKEDAVRDFMDMTYNSWTYSRFTEDEKCRWEDVVAWCTGIEQIRGSYKQRWSQMQMIYLAFLHGLGYTGAGWRDSMDALKYSGRWDSLGA